MSNQITVNNYTYTSIAAAWRAISPKGLPLVTVRWRLKEGWAPELAFLQEPVHPKFRRKFRDLRY